MWVIGMGGDVMVERASAQGIRARGRPRARHDAGIEPVSWGRIVLVMAVVVFAVGAALAAAGLASRGPLSGPMSELPVRLGAQQTAALPAAF